MGKTGKKPEAKGRKRGEMRKKEGRGLQSSWKVGGPFAGGPGYNGTVGRFRRKRRE